MVSLEEKRQLRSRTASETAMSPKRSHKKHNVTVVIPIPSSPKKKKNSGRKAIEFTEFQQANIRYFVKRLQNIC